MTWGAIGGAAIGAVGSYMGGKASQPKMPKFNPYSISGSLFGDTSFNKKDHSITMTPNGTVQGFADANSAMANQYFGGNSPTNPYQQWAMGAVQNQIPGLFGEGMNFSQVDASPYARYDQQMGGVGANLYGGGAQAMQMGFGMLGEAPQGYRDVQDQRLALLREQAAPFEQRAFNANNQNLFSTGRMGTSGGGMQTEAFARGLAQADTGRQLDSQSFAEQLYGRDLNASLQRNSTGLGLLGLSNNLFGSAGSAYGSQFGGATQFNDLGNARAQQRLQNAQGMFGFGNSLASQDFQTGTAAMQNYFGIGDALQNQAKFGAEVGGIGMGAGMPTSGGSSPWGAALQGLGGAVSNFDFSKLFNSAPTNSSYSPGKMTLGNYGPAAYTTDLSKIAPSNVRI